MIVGFVYLGVFRCHAGGCRCYITVHLNIYCRRRWRFVCQIPPPVEVFRSKDHIINRILGFYSTVPYRNSRTVPYSTVPYRIVPYGTYCTVRYLKRTDYITVRYDTVHLRYGTVRLLRYGTVLKKPRIWFRM